MFSECDWRSDVCSSDLYGRKPKETVISYAIQIVKFLQTKDVKAVVIACNRSEERRVGKEC